MQKESSEKQYGPRKQNNLIGTIKTEQVQTGCYWYVLSNQIHHIVCKNASVENNFVTFQNAELCGEYGGLFIIL